MFYRSGGGWSLGRVFASAVVRKLGYVLAAALVAVGASQCHAAQCVGVDAGAIVVLSEPVDTCSGYVLATATEFHLMASAGLGELSIESGAAIGAAIMLCWAIAWCVMSLRRATEI